MKRKKSPKVTLGLHDAEMTDKILELVEKLENKHVSTILENALLDAMKKNNVYDPSDESRMKMRKERFWNKWVPVVVPMGYRKHWEGIDDIYNVKWWYEELCDDDHWGPFYEDNFPCTQEQFHTELYAIEKYDQE